ncbi:MAG TPA: hypothetical protein PKX87_02435 [Alphaproteobacteria bacterium]|nr:hypothetical protein [Alphaproteobacteria bacterium]
MVAFIEKVHFNEADFVRPPLELFDKVTGRNVPVHELPTEQDECRLRLPAEGPHLLHVSFRQGDAGDYHIVLSLYSPAYEPVVRAELPFSTIVSAYESKVPATDAGTPDVAAMEAAREALEPALKPLLAPWIKGSGASLQTILARGLVRSVFDLRAAMADVKRLNLKKIASEADPYGGLHRSYDDHRRAN